MEMVRFGKTGMQVSKICLGCMTYGSTKWREWVLEEEASRPFIQEALERGINFFDTADVYSQGGSEEIVGRALKDFAAPQRSRHRDQGAWRDGHWRQRQGASRASTSWKQSTPR